MSNSILLSQFQAHIFLLKKIYILLWIYFSYIDKYINLRVIMDNKVYLLPLNNLLNYKSRSKE